MYKLSFSSYSSTESVSHVTSYNTPNPRRRHLAATFLNSNSTLSADYST